MVQAKPRLRTVAQHAFWRSRRFPRVLNWQLGLILLLGAALRFEQIRQPYVDAFSWRQSDTAMIAENYFRHNWNIFFVELNWNGPEPGYQGREFQTVTYISALLYTLVGQHDWVGRTVAVVFGLWGIVALYHLVRLAWRQDYALVAALVMAVMPGAVFVDRSFLPDPAMVALMVTSLWLWLRYLQTGRWRYLLLGGVVGGWGACTKITGLIVGLPMAYAWFTLGDSRQRWRPSRLAGTALFATLILAPTTAYYLWARHLALSYTPYHFAGAGKWLWDTTVAQWVSERYYLPQLFKHYSDWIWRWPVAALVVLGLLFRPPTGDLARSPRSAEATDSAPWLFHVWLLAGGVYYLIGARELVENPWNFHILNPAAAALSAYAIALLATRRSEASWTAVSLGRVAVVLLLIWLVGRAGLDWMYHPYAEDDYRLGLALREVTEPDDLALTITSHLGDPVAIYYSRRRGWPFPPPRAFLGWNHLSVDDGESIELFEDLRARGAGWLGIVSWRRGDLEQYHPALMTHIRQTASLWSENEHFSIYRLSSAAGRPQPTVTELEASRQ